MSNIKHKKDQSPRDENGKAHGEWITYYRNDQLSYRWNYVHGVIHGYNEGYHKNGKLRYHGYWNMNRRIGYWYWYNSKKRYYLCLI